MTKSARNSFTARLRQFDPTKVAILAVGFALCAVAAHIVGGIVSGWIVGRVNPLLGILLTLIVLTCCVRELARIAPGLVASMKRDAAPR